MTGSIAELCKSDAPNWGRLNLIRRRKRQKWACDHNLQFACALNSSQKHVPCQKIQPLPLLNHKNIYLNGISYKISIAISFFLYYLSSWPFETWKLRPWWCKKMHSLKIQIFFCVYKLGRLSLLWLKKSIDLLIYLHLVRFCFSCNCTTSDNLNSSRKSFDMAD
jgi:hypothetical protein